MKLRKRHQLKRKFSDLGEVSSKDGSEGHKRNQQTFKDTPEDWHSVIRVKNPETERNHLFFKCNHPGCRSVFKKSCNLRDHFRKHTGLRPFQCLICKKNFT